MSAARPPLRAVLAYRVLGRRPDPQYDDWLRADLDSRWYGVRQALPVVAAGAVVCALLLLPPWFSWPMVVVGFVAGTAIAMVGAGRDRQRVRDRFFPMPEIGPWRPYVGADRVEEDS